MRTDCQGHSGRALVVLSRATGEGPFRPDPGAVVVRLVGSLPWADRPMKVGMTWMVIPPSLSSPRWRGKNGDWDREERRRKRLSDRKGVPEPIYI